MEAQLLQAQQEATLNVNHDNMRPTPVASGFATFSNWFGLPKQLPTLASLTSDQSVNSSSTPIDKTPTATRRSGPLDDIANGICSQPGSRQTTPPQSENPSEGEDGKTPDWKQRMIDRNEAAKQDMIKIMDDSLNSVVAKLEKKPYAQRDSGADSYTKSVNWIMWSVSGIINRVK